jgi:hypothetical protein
MRVMQVFDERNGGCREVDEQPETFVGKRQPVALLRAASRSALRGDYRAPGGAGDTGSLRANAIITSPPDRGGRTRVRQRAHLTKLQLDKEYFTL